MAAQNTSDDFTKSTSTLVGIPDIVENHLLPSGRNLEVSLQSLLEQAQQHQRYCLISKTIATTIGAVGSIVTCVGISLSSATMGLSVTFSTPLAFSLTGLAAMMGIGTVVVDEFVLRRRSLDKLQKIVADYEGIKQSWIEQLNFERLDLCMREADLVTFYSSHEFRSSIVESVLFSLKSRFVDAKYTVNEIREGDHLVTHQRQISKSYCRSHGIYIGKNAAGVKLVADFGSHLPIFRPIHQFCSEKSPTRNHDLAIAKQRKPIELLNQSVNQLHRLIEKIADLSKPIQTAFDTIVASIHGANFLFKVKFDKMFTDVLKVVRARNTAVNIKWRTLEQIAPKQAVKKIGLLSKTLVLITPIMTAVDVYQLCKECQEQDLQPHMRDIVGELNVVMNDVNTFENILHLLGRKF
ncbi:hypothetical protein Bhyg_03247 [Pseudolycoriella hygida]|uniref:Uncharacterized protein n=1 Tax=Pseudolycoriella hygida TaxID=35572 RepID=A0A9Q0S7B6_9DIPT|nr:hypothetical protein Bhyg_03247 [Pseudolycoriella hygida]